MEGVKGRFRIFLERISKINKNIWFILIFFFSVFLYLHNITFSDMWIDEAFTHALAKHSLGEIAGLVRGDYHPPLYFYGLKIFVFIFGVSVFTIRFFFHIGRTFNYFIRILWWSAPVWEKWGSIFLSPDAFTSYACCLCTRRTYVFMGSFCSHRNFPLCRFIYYFK